MSLFNLVQLEDVGDLLGGVGAENGAKAFRLLGHSLSLESNRKCFFLSHSYHQRHTRTPEIRKTMRVLELLLFQSNFPAVI